MCQYNSIDIFRSKCRPYLYASFCKMLSVVGLSSKNNNSFKIGIKPYGPNPSLQHPPCICPMHWLTGPRWSCVLAARSWSASPRTCRPPASPHQWRRWIHVIVDAPLEGYIETEQHGVSYFHFLLRLTEAFNLRDIFFLKPEWKYNRTVIKWHTGNPGSVVWPGKLWTRGATVTDEHIRASRLGIS